MKKTCLTAMLCVAFCVCAVFFSLGLTACGEKINEYSVEFVIAADENFTKTVKEGEALDEPDAPTRGGYAFVGWAKDEKGSAPWIFAADRVNSDLTLYAVWAKLYTVTLDANGGNFAQGVSVSKQSLAENSTVTAPDEPKKEGYKFTGWAYDARGTQVWNINQNKVTGDITLYAVWAKKFDIIFNADGGEFENAPEGGEATEGGYKFVYAHGDYLAEISAPKKRNYIFKGWFADGKKWDFETSTVDGETILKAQWEEVYADYEVTFKLNYEGAADVVKTTENGLAVYEPDEREGYTFNGWWYGTVKDGKLALTERFDATVRLTEDTTLYADWIDETKLIKVLATPQISREANTFSWQPIEGATKYTVQVRQGNEVLNTYVTESTTWSFASSNKYSAGVTYGVYVNAVGNNVNTITSGWGSSSYLYRTLSAPKVSFDITTSLLSWSAVGNAAGYKLYINNEQITKDVKNYSYDMSGYEAGAYTVRVETVAPSGYQNSQTTVSVVQYKILAPEVSVLLNEETNGYKVTVSETGQADLYIIEIDGEPFKTVRKDENFTSESLNFEFPFDDEIWEYGKFGFSVRAENAGSYYIGSAASEITIAKPVNVKIAVSGAEGENAFELSGKTFNTSLAETAEYTVTFDLNGGSGLIKPQTVTGNKPLVYPYSKPTRSGFIFRGWFTTPECETVFDFTQKLNKDVTLYAGWFEMVTNVYASHIVCPTSSTRWNTISIGTSRYSCMYFSVLNSGTIMFQLDLATQSNYVYFAIEEAVEQSSIEGGKWNSNSTVFTADVNAGEVIRVRAIVHSGNSNTFECKVTAVNGSAYDNTPEAGGTVEGGYLYAEEKECVNTDNLLMAGQPVTLTAKRVYGKKFKGWYAGDKCVSTDMIVTVTPEEDITYTATYETE